MKVSSFVYFLVIFIIINYVFLIVFNDINEDEALFAENSYRLVTEGKVRSEFFSGFKIGLENIQLQYHKLFIVLGSLFVWLFDSSLYSYRLLTIIFSTFFFIIFRNYLVSKRNKEFWLLTISLLFIQSTFCNFTLIFRPEIMVMFFGFCSWVFLEKTINNKSVRVTIIAGLFAGLALLTHLNGIIFIVSGTVLLLTKKSVKLAIIFGLSSVIISLLYFWDINSIELLNIWINQFRNDPTMIESGKNLIITPFLKLAEEHKRFFHSGEEISLSILFICSVIFSWEKLIKDNLELLIYLLALIISLGLVAHGKTVKYQILYMPYIFIIISISIYHSEHFQKKILYGLLSLYIIVNTYSLYTNLNFDYNPIESNRTIASQIEDGSNVMAKERFFFNEGTRFNIQSPLSFVWYYERYLRKGYELKDFFDFNKEYKNKYIIIDRYAFDKKILELLDREDLKIDKLLYGYKVKKIEEQYIIFKSIK